MCSSQIVLNGVLADYIVQLDKKYKNYKNTSQCFFRKREKTATCWKHQARVNFQAFTAGAAQMTVVWVIQLCGIMCFFLTFQWTIRTTVSLAIPLIGHNPCNLPTQSNHFLLPVISE
jgi:hypothetical protein